MSKIRISASTIKTFCNCSFLFWIQYFKNVPSVPHQALPKGTLVHLLLELILIRCKKYPKFRQLVLKNPETVIELESIQRLIRKTLIAVNLYNKEVLNEINSWLLVGLKADFLIEGSKDILSEQQFDLPLGKGRVTGTIDKIGISDEEIKIRDYKSTKQKFSGEDKEANTQALLYLWAATQLFPGRKRYTFEFIFLRFPRNPIQSHSYTFEQIEGFMNWAMEVSEKMLNLNEESAEENFAFDDIKKKWLCQAGKTWKCPYRDAFEYYELLNKTGEPIRQSMKNDFTLKEGQRVIKREYSGCPRHLKFLAPVDESWNDEF